MIPIGEVKSFFPELLRKKVMVVTNEDQPIETGRIIGFTEISQSNQKWPVVRRDDGQELFGGLILPYDEDFKELLESKPHKERFQFLCNMFWLRGELSRIEYHLDPQRSTNDSPIRT
jgi:hypothetical protein